MGHTGLGTLGMVVVVVVGGGGGGGEWEDTSTSFSQLQLSVFTVYKPCGYN